MSLPWIHRCGAVFDTLAEHDAHAANCGPWAEAAPAETTTELAKHVLETIRDAKKSLQRIMDNEMSYREP